MASNRNTHLVFLKELLGIVCLLTLVRVVNCRNWTSFASVSESYHLVPETMLTTSIRPDKRPDIRAPVLNISIKKDCLLSPGYLFLTPYDVDMPGPYIYDTSGSLVWSGANSSATDIFHDLHVCPYNGSDHLCVYQGAQTEGYARGHSTILDSTYQPVATVQSGDGLLPSDLHEMRVIDGTTALITIYQTGSYNLKAYDIDSENGWVIAGVFQEVDIEAGEVLFEWNSLDHVPLSATLAPLRLDEVVGDGLTNGSAWDYFHINSVDKNDDGDYLVSARHTGSIYKVSGTDGSILWQLGGSDSSFQLTNYNFSYQHDARFRGGNETTTVLSFFDNGSNQHKNISSTSAGMIVSIDHCTNTSTLIRQYHAPGLGLLSVTQGNIQILPNKNVVIGWGSKPSISEHTEDGTTVFFATFVSPDSQNYRAFKSNWTAMPSDTPALRSYSASPNSTTAFWVSWNGATDVDSWRFYATTPDSECDGFMPLDVIPSQGFETTYVGSAHYFQAFAEALAADGSSLANSTTVDTSSTSP